MTQSARQRTVATSTLRNMQESGHDDNVGPVCKVCWVFDQTAVTCQLELNSPSGTMYRVLVTRGSEKILCLGLPLLVTIEGLICYTLDLCS